MEFYNDTARTLFMGMQRDTLFSLNNRVFLDTNTGNVGIGTMTPDSRLDVEGGDIRITTAGRGLISPDGSKQTAAAVAGGGSGWIDDGTNVRLATIGNRVGIGTTAPVQKLDVCGNVVATTYFHHSDEELKTEITPLQNNLSRILKLDPVSFRWREDNELALGLIAQDVEKIFPEIVHTEKESGLKSINYSALIAPLIEAISEQQEQIDGLKIEIKDLKLLIK